MSNITVAVPTMTSDASLTAAAKTQSVDVGVSSHYHIQCHDSDGNLRWEEDADNRVVTAGLNILLTQLAVTIPASVSWFVGLCGASVTDGAMTTGVNSTTLTCGTSTPFSAVDAGRSIVVRGAGTTGADLITTIASFTSSSVVVLTAGCATTVSAASVIFDARAVDTLASHTPWVENTNYTGNRQAYSPAAASAGTITNGASVASFPITTNNTILGGAFLASTNTGTTGTLYGMATFSGGFRQAQNGDTMSVTLVLTAAST